MIKQSLQQLVSWWLYISQSETQYSASLRLNIPPETQYFASRRLNTVSSRFNNPSDSILCHILRVRDSIFYQRLNTLPVSDSIFCQSTIQYSASDSIFWVTDSIFCESEIQYSASQRWMDGWIKLIVGFQPLMVISPTASCWCVCTGPVLY